jgi:hypothetical protein
MSRIDGALGIGSQDYSEGAFCVRPEEVPHEQRAA